MSSLEDFLEDQRQGRLDSRGTFTLDWTRARQAYKGLSKADPSAFLIKLLQAAFASRPSLVDVKLEVPVLEFSWTGGQTLSKDQLSQLEAHLLQGLPVGHQRPLKHLAQALLLLGGRDDLCLTLESPQGSLALGPTGFTRGGGTGSAATTIRIKPVEGAQRLVQPSLLDFDLLSPRISRAWPEFRMIRGKLGCHSAPLSINGKALQPHGRGRPEVLLATRVHLPPHVELCGLGFDPHVRAKNCKFYLPNGKRTRELQSQYLNARVLASARFLDFGYSQDGEDRQTTDTLQLVADGIPIHTSTTWLGEVGIFVVLDASELPVDASTLAPVQGPQFDACLREARTMTDHFFEEMEAATKHKGILRRWLFATTLEREFFEARKRLQSVPRRF